MESRSFRKFLEEKSAKIKVERQGQRISWDEEVKKDKHSFTGFLEFAYSNRASGDYIYLDRSTAFDIVDRINWMETRIKRLTIRLKILLLLLIASLLAAVWGWLT
ncbi:MAG: hypothetical protein HA496_08735 [Thaumarchaeota archaeon]|nr:hypothetical protein [Nitrososphaerota archaeon]